jgi:hypothetical protein
MTSTERTNDGHRNGHAQHAPWPEYADTAETIRTEYGPGAVEADELPTELLEFPTDGSVATEAEDEYVIKGVIVRRSIGTIYGPSGVGKTSVAIGTGFQIAIGLDCYGRRVRRCPVLYCAYEGIGGARKRMAAAVRKYGSPGNYFARLVITPTLNKSREGLAGARQIIAAARQLAAIAGAEVGLIIIDTKARATAGDDEDKAGDAAAYLERISLIARETGAAVCTVHHTGKDAERGMRGSSALSAGDDWRILINAERNVIIDKSRDDEGGPWFSYNLKPMTLRIDSEGDPVTACTVEVLDEDGPLATHGGKSKTKKPLRSVAKRALAALGDLTGSEGVDVPLAEIDLVGIAPHKRPRCVKLSRWREECKKRRLAASDEESDANFRQHWRRATEELATVGKVGFHGDWIWLVGQQRKSGAGDSHG